MGFPSFSSFNEDLKPNKLESKKKKSSHSSDLHLHSHSHLHSHNEDSSRKWKNGESIKRKKSMVDEVDNDSKKSRNKREKTFLKDKKHINVNTKDTSFHIDNLKSWKKTEGNFLSNSTSLSFVAGNSDKNIKSTEELFFIDTRGNPSNLLYNSLYKYDISNYKRYSNNVLGIDSNLVIDHNETDSSGVCLVYYKPLLKTKLNNFKSSSKFTNLKISNNETEGEIWQQDFISLSSGKNKQKKIKNGEKIDDYRSVLNLPWTEVHFDQSHASNTIQDDDNSDDDYADSDCEINTFEDKLKKKLLDCSAKLLNDMKDIELWHELIRLQTEYNISTGSKNVGDEILLAIYEKAIKFNPTSSSLILKYMELYEKIYPLDKVKEKWEHFGENCLEDNEVLINWAYFLSFKCEDNFYVIVEVIKKIFHKLKNKSHSPSIKSDNAIISIIFFFCNLLQRYGYYEIFISYLQALLELNFFSPNEKTDKQEIVVSFSQFWKLELPRIGEPDGRGWKNLNNRERIKNIYDFINENSIENHFKTYKNDQFDESIKNKTITYRLKVKKWLQDEILLSRTIFPERTVYNKGDSFRVCLFEDFKEFLYLFSSQKSKEFFFWNFLKYLDRNNTIEVDGYNDVLFGNDIVPWWKFKNKTFIKNIIKLVINEIQDIQIILTAINWLYDNYKLTESLFIKSVLKLHPDNLRLWSLYFNREWELLLENNEQLCSIRKRYNLLLASIGSRSESVLIWRVYIYSEFKLNKDISLKLIRNYLKTRNNNIEINGKNESAFFKKLVEENLKNDHSDESESLISLYVLHNYLTNKNTNESLSEALKLSNEYFSVLNKKCYFSRQSLIYSLACHCIKIINFHVGNYKIFPLQSVKEFLIKMIERYPSEIIFLETLTKIYKKFNVPLVLREDHRLYMNIDEKMPLKTWLDIITLKKSLCGDKESRLNATRNLFLTTIQSKRFRDNSLAYISYARFEETEGRGVEFAVSILLRALKSCPGSKYLYIEILNHFEFLSEQEIIQIFTHTLRKELRTHVHIPIDFVLPHSNDSEDNSG